MDDLERLNNEEITLYEYERIQYNKGSKAMIIALLLLAILILLYITI